MCRDKTNPNWRHCSYEDICFEKDRIFLKIGEETLTNKSLEYRQSQEGQWFVNWFVNLDRLCYSKSENNSALSYYFIGYGVGFIFFFLPNAYGRKKSMTFAVLFQHLGCYISLYSPTLETRKIGFFMQGFFHLKTTLSYSYCGDFIPERYKVLSTTVIVAFDSASVGFMNAYLAYYSRDLHGIFNIMFYIQSVVVVLFIIFVPESPQWLFLEKDSNSKEAIDILNYIAVVNGSKMRVPYDAFFDMMG
jgi:MFS family permease